MKKYYKDGDYIITIERIPRFKMFNLGNGATDEEGKSTDKATEKSIKEYESLLKLLEDSEDASYMSSSGVWGEDGRYRVQVHWYDIKETKALREDTDFASADGEEPVTRKGEHFDDLPDINEKIDLFVDEDAGLSPEEIEKREEETFDKLVESRTEAIVGYDSIPEEKRK